MLPVMVFSFQSTILSIKEEFPKCSKASPISIYFLLPHKLMVAWVWRSPLSLFLIFPTIKITIGSHVLPGGVLPFQIPCFVHQKNPFEFEKPIRAYHPRRPTFFKNFFFNSPKVIFNNAQKSSFPSQSLTRINSSYMLVDFLIKTSNY